jgi:hypothetical protein
LNEFVGQLAQDNVAEQIWDINRKVKWIKDTLACKEEKLRKWEEGDTVTV